MSAVCVLAACSVQSDQIHIQLHDYVAQARKAPCLCSAGNKDVLFDNILQSGNTLQGDVLGRLSAC